MRRAKHTLVVAAITLASCTSQIIPAATPTTNSALLRLVSTTATLPLANELTATYNQRFPSIAFDVSAGNYESTVDEVVEDDTAYLLTNHLPTESPLLAFPVGQDAIAVIVHPDNAVHRLTTHEIRDIYQGRITNWLELGGEDRAITVVSREGGSGTRAEFDRLVMGDRRTTRAALIAPSSAAMVTSVGRELGAIGYVSIGYLSPNVRAVAVDGVEPTLDRVRDNAYPLRSTLFIVGAREPEGDMRAFVGWVQGPEGQAVVSRLYAPLTAP